MGEILKYYYATIKYLIEQETPTGKLKYKSKKDDYLINAKSITSAQTTLKGILGGIYDSFEITAIKESNIVGVINQVQDVLKK